MTKLEYIQNHLQNQPLLEALLKPKTHDCWIYALVLTKHQNTPSERYEVCFRILRIHSISPMILR